MPHHRLVVDMMRLGRRRRWRSGSTYPVPLGDRTRGFLMDVTSTAPVLTDTASATLYDPTGATECLDRHLRDPALHRNIIGAHEGHEFTTHAVHEADQRDPVGCDLGDRALQRLVVSRCEQDGIRPLPDHSTQQRCLLE